MGKNGAEEKLTCKILITGIHSVVAKDLNACLSAKGYSNIVVIGSKDVDLTKQKAVYDYFALYKPDVVFHVAARTAGAYEDSREPWDILRDNLMLECNVFEACVRSKVKKIIWVSGDAAFPYSETGKVMTEEDLFGGYVDRMREAYGFAKAMGAKMLEYIERQEKICTVSLFPCYIYGNVKKGLVYSLFNDFTKAKRENIREVIVWGREDTSMRFIHSRDVASALCFALEHDMAYNQYIIAPEKVVTRLTLAQMIAQSICYGGEIKFDGRDGIRPSANAFSQRLYHEGWQPKVSLEEGLKELNHYIQML